MPFNPSRRDQRDEQAYLTAQLGATIARAEASRQRALSDARRVIAQRYQGQYLSVSDYGLRATLESRGDDGYGEAGSVHEDGPRKRHWLVLWHWETGERRLRRTR